MQDTQIRSLCGEDALGKGMAIESSILTWRIPCIEELVGYSSWGHKESDVTEQVNTFLVIRLELCFFFFFNKQFHRSKALFGYEFG